MKRLEIVHNHKYGHYGYDVFRDSKKGIRANEDQFWNSKQLF